MTKTFASIDFQFIQQILFRSAKGSHTCWYHELLPDDPITISGKDGDDAKKYLEK